MYINMTAKLSKTTLKYIELVGDCALYLNDSD